MWYLLMQINIYLHVLFCFVEARINKLIFSSPFVCPLVNSTDNPLWEVVATLTSVTMLDNGCDQYKTLLLLTLTDTGSTMIQL
jgi:hypothetical protein